MSSHAGTPGRGGGLALLLAAGVVWGTIGPAVDVAHERSALSPLAIGGYRAAMAVAALLLAVVVTRRWGRCVALVREEGWRVLVAGVLTATFQLLFFVAVVLAGVSVTTVVALGFAPVLLLVLGSARDRRLPSLSQTLTVATAVAGLVLVTSGGGSGGTTGAHAAWGLVAALGSGAAYALGADVGGSLIRGRDPLAVTACTIVVVAAVLVPLGLGVDLVRGHTIRTTDAGTWATIGYLGLVTMAFAYVLLYAGLRSTPSGTAVVVTLVEPVTAVLIAVAFLGESLSGAGVVGCLLILGAIAGGSRARPRSAAGPRFPVGCR